MKRHVLIGVRYDTEFYYDSLDKRFASSLRHAAKLQYSDALSHLNDKEIRRLAEKRGLERLFVEQIEIVNA